MKCLCCADALLRHASRAGVYWYCPTCRQVMPVLGNNRTGSAISRASEF